MTRRVYISGVAMTRFGRHPDADLFDLAEDAGRSALRDAGLEPEDVDALYVGCFLGQSLGHQGVIASLIARRLNLGDVPTTTVEGACASGGIALRGGVLSCRAGAAEVVLCIGAEHLTSHDTPTVTDGLAQATLRATDGRLGLTFPGFFGLVASAHAARYGTTREQLSSVAMQSRRHAVRNPNAMFRDSVELEQIANARPIADPLRLLDCSPISDGAAAAVVTVDGPRRCSSGGVVEVLACEQASGAVGISQIDDLTSFPATIGAARRAYDTAGVTPAEVDVVELHDCFSIAAIVDCEDLELLPRGDAGQAILDGATSFDGDSAFVNPSGGLLARGHPVGATGLAQIHELVQQLRGDAHTQVQGAKIAMAHNLGGCGATATVTVLSG